LLFHGAILLVFLHGLEEISHRFKFGGVRESEQNPDFTYPSGLFNKGIQNPMFRIVIVLAFSCLALLACGPSDEPTAPGTEAETTDASEPQSPLPQTLSGDERLAAFFEDVFERNVAQSPEFQAHLCLKTEDYGKWDDASDARARELHEQSKDDQERLRSDFDFDQLSDDSQLSYRIFEYELEHDLAMFAWRDHHYAVSQMRNIAGAVPTFMQNVHKVDTREDAEAYIERLQGVETLMAQHVEKLQASEEIGVVPPMMVYPRVLPAARNMLTGAPFEESAEDGVLLADFRAKVEALEIDENDAAMLVNDAANALSGPFRRGYNALITELTRLQDIADDNNGVWDLPDGGEYYAAMANFWTTVDMSPDEIHELGLAEVARIRAEMEAIRDEVGFEGDLAAFFEFVRTSPENYYPNTDEGRAEYLADALLPPRTPLLLTQPGLIGRYQLASFLGRLVHAARDFDDAAAILLLVPGHEGGRPTIGDLAIPGLLPGQSVWVPGPWLSRASRADGASESRSDG
jgi:hypothetical protein